MYYIYMVRCADDSLYTGIAADIARRLRQHIDRTSACAKYTRARQVVALAGLWTAADRSAASKLEYQLKRLTRAQKLRLLAQDAPQCDVCPALASAQRLAGATLEACLAGAYAAQTEV